MEHRKINAYLAGFVLVFTWIIYFMTKAPTVSFWDCGEFVACSYSLGIPHPPGTPLFVLLGKVMSMILWFIKEKAVRITLISTTGGALSSMFAYLIAVRFLLLGYGMPSTFWKRVALYGGGIISALCTAFASTLWFNNVESEVYGANIAIMMLTNWLILKWAEKRSEPDSDRYIILIVFLAFLNIGLHVQSLLILPSFFLYVILMDKEKLHDWRFWVMGVVLFMQALEVGTFLWLAPAALIITIIVMVFSTPTQRKGWLFVFWMCLVALLGYSVHLYIPIRSAQNPIIDENNPETLKEFKYFLERKQYGNESMTKQMFTRHGSIRGQLWDGPNMGYGLYHIKQFNRDLDLYKVKPSDPSWLSFDLSKPSELLRLLFYLIPTFIMFYGMYMLYQRNRESSIMFITLYFATSFGLILYMNFKDGTVEGFAREVRERDYFFSVGFLYYMFWIGIGASAFMNWLLDHKKEIVRKVVAPGVIIAMLFIPAVPLAANYKTHDRTGNYVPWDYSYNLLMSCGKNGILFTNGDNDTFPVWALQEAYGIRRDVRIVNLSLLNTGWYIKQLKLLEPKVPINLSMKEIESLQHQLNPFKGPVRHKIGITGLEVTLPGKNKKRILRIQDIMVLNIVGSTNWKKPIYFAVTVSDDNKMGLDPYLSMEALVFKLNKTPRRERMNIEKSIKNLTQVYKYRGLGDGSCHLDYDARKLLSNYTASFIGVALEERRPLEMLRDKAKAVKGFADSLTAKKDKEAETKKLEADALYKTYQERLDRTINLLRMCNSIVVDDWRPRMLLMDLLTTHGRFEEAEKVAKNSIKVEPTRQEYRYYLAQAQEKAGKKPDAIKSYRDLIAINGDYYNAYSSIANMFTAMGQKDSAIATYEDWLRRHPGDKRAERAVKKLKNDSI